MSEKWCEHIENLHIPTVEPNWIFDELSDERNFDVVKHGWEFCPICGAKKPEQKERKKLLEILRPILSNHCVNSTHTYEAAKTSSEAAKEWMIELIKKTLIISKGEFIAPALDDLISRVREG